ncbi:hypothetical protein ES702_07140 [subsurface metagenome]
MYERHGLERGLRMIWTVADVETCVVLPILQSQPREWWFDRVMCCDWASFLQVV